MTGLSEEEKKAIKDLKEYLDWEELQGFSKLPRDKHLETILNLIQKQDTEINKLNNVIDRMAEVLNDFDYDKQCESCRTDICSASVDGTEYTHCIREYFMKEDK